MTQLSLLTAAAAAAPKHLDPLALFLQADIVVQAVMVGLVLASLFYALTGVLGRVAVGPIPPGCRGAGGVARGCP